MEHCNTFINSCKICYKYGCSHIEKIDKCLCNSCGDNLCSCDEDDGSCPEDCTGCPSALGDMNADGIWNVQDIVLLVDCVLNDNCGEIDNACAGDINGDGTWNVLDIVNLSMCVLAGNCEDL